MSGSIAHSQASERLARTVLSALALSALLVGCRPDSEAAAPQVRPVRTVTVEKHEAGSPVTLTGRIEAKDEVALGFRISGRLLENTAKLGDRVKPGQVIARLEPQNELNQLRSAEANLAAAQAQLTQAQNHFERQDTLLRQGWTTRAIWDQAKKALQTAQPRAALLAEDQSIQPSPQNFASQDPPAAPLRARALVRSLSGHRSG